MHVTIIIGLGFFGGHPLATLILFVMIKTIMDMIYTIGDYKQIRALTRESLTTD